MLYRIWAAGEPGVQMMTLPTESCFPGPMIVIQDLHGHCEDKVRVCIVNS